MIDDDTGEVPACDATKDAAVAYDWPGLRREISQLRRELDALRRERDALIDMHIEDAGPLGFPGMFRCGVTSQLHSFREDAVAAVRNAAGLTEAPR